MGLIFFPSNFQTKFLQIPLLLKTDCRVFFNSRIFAYLYIKILELIFSNRLNRSYKDEPRPEYAPKKNSVNKPRAASPPTVATIQRGILPISLILIIVIKK